MATAERIDLQEVRPKAGKSVRKSLQESGTEVLIQGYCHVVGRKADGV